MAYLALMFAFMYFGRKIGWALSKALLYRCNRLGLVSLCVLWGGLVAFGVYSAIGWLHPAVILEVIFGFGLGAYVSVPNYGLIAESSIPEHAIPRHVFVSNAPLVTYIAALLALAWIPLDAL